MNGQIWETMYSTETWYLAGLSAMIVVCAECVAAYHHWKYISSFRVNGQLPTVPRSSYLGREDCCILRWNITK